MIVNPDRPYDGANRPQDNAAGFAGPEYSPREPTAEEWDRFRQLVAFQHAYVGSPMTYYGDEAGMWSPDDPSNRQPFPWPDQGPYEGAGVGFNEEIFDHFQRVIAAREYGAALQLGGYRTLLADDDAGVLAFERATDDAVAVAAFNRGTGEQRVTLDVPAGTYVDLLDPAQAELSVPEDARPTLTPTGEGHDAADGKLTVTLPVYGSAYLVRQ